MAVRDTWHLVLVYFGLAEDTIRPRRRRLRAAAALSRPRSDSTASTPPSAACRSRRSRRDDIDDIFADDASPADRRRDTAPRAVARAATAQCADVRVHLVIPRSFNDAQDVADQFKPADPGDSQPAGPPTPSSSKAGSTSPRA